jgi:outer membrane murein-binding lipoprotein Lpp
MSEAIIVALITGGLSLAGVVVTCVATAKKTEKSMEISQAVMKTEIKELTREVRAHNDFASRVPKLEADVENIKNTIEDLKSFHIPN